MKRRLSLGKPSIYCPFGFLQLLPQFSGSHQFGGRLHRTCLPAYYELREETSPLAREIRSEAFGLNFDPIKSSNGILSGISHLIDTPVTAELYKVNSYGPGSMVKAHKSTQPEGNRLGTLVVVLPSHFEGGEFILRDSGEEMTFNWSTSGRKDHPHDLQWVFFTDIEQEILPVKTGHRLTVSYHIFRAHKPSTPDIKEGDEGEEYLQLRTDGMPTGNLSLQYKLTTLFSSLVSSYKNSKFLPNGGQLVFSLAHDYGVAGNPIVKIDDDYYKGKDAVLISTLKAMGLSYRFRAVYRVDGNAWNPQPDKFATAPNDDELFLLWNDFSGCVGWFQLSCSDADKRDRVHPNLYNEASQEEALEDFGAEIDHSWLWVNRPSKYAEACRYAGIEYKPQVYSMGVAAGVLVDIPAFGTSGRIGTLP